MVPGNSMRLWLGSPLLRSERRCLTPQSRGTGRKRPAPYCELLGVSVKVTVRFSTLFLAVAVLLFPFPYDWLPQLVSAAGYDGRTVGGILMYIEGPIVLLSLLSAASLLVYS